MKRGLWNKRMPTGFAFLLLILGIGLTTYFIQQRTNLTGNASPEKEPQNVVVSNINESSFTVNFTTTSPASAAVSVEGGVNPIIAYDQESSASKRTPTLSHLIRVENLAPNTAYKFSILSDGETYLKNGQQYTVTTGPQIGEANINQSPINGKVILPDGQAATETLVELSIPGAQLLTVLTNNDGQYAIPLETIRNSQLNGYKKISSTDVFTITALRGDLKTTIQVSANNSTEIPPVTLSQSYNFTSQTIEEISTPSSQLKIPPAGSSGSRSIAISVPTKDQSFIDDRPRFSGSAFPNQDVKVIINPSKTTTTVKSSSAGVWTYRPDPALLPGNYTVTVQSPDQSGIMRSASQTFVIFSSGSQLSPNASQSATTPSPTKKPTSTPTSTPTRTPTPTIGVTSTITTTPIPSASPTVLPTATPTIAATTPTPTVIAKPTITLSPTSIAVATTQPTPLPPPATGTTTTTVVLTTISLLLIFAGSALIFLL